MKGNSFVALGTSIAVLIFAGQALGAGGYQRTDDRKKTLVWNNDPKPGDAAEWTGKRDPEGYAEGPGTLTWLQPQKQSLFSTGSNIPSTKKVPISRLTGTMAHGKFEGTVTTAERGKTYYARYVGGQRKGNWSREPIIAKASAAEPAATNESKKAPSVPAKLAAAEKVESPAEPKISDEAEPEPPTEGPDEAKPDDRGQRSGVSTAKTATPLIAQASSEADESATPRQQPVTKKAALAPGAVRAIEKPTQTVSKKTEKPKQTSEKIRKATRVETPKPEPSQEQIESPAEGPLSTRVEKSEIQNPKPETGSSHLSAEASAKEEPSSLNIQPSAEQTPVDNSIRTLTGPPASLRAKLTPPPEAAPPQEIPASAIAPATSSANTPKLNAVQAMDIADIQARTNGYDLGDYQLPKAEYNASDDTWAVSYKSKSDKKTKHLSVTVQDKSGKAEVGK
ncbi:MAG TPA: hypothetical protein VKS98_02930 [Chthoniobacterales bacterium]|nr:hypothetical protein [Chthoniobacterales bacterium]